MKNFIDIKQGLTALHTALQSIGTVIDSIPEPSTGGAIDYSTTEVATGEKWIDGKPIYRVVLHSADTGNTATFSASTVTPETIVRADLCFVQGGSYPGVVCNGVDVRMLSDYSITVNVSGSTAPDGRSLILEYTKESE